LSSSELFSDDFSCPKIIKKRVDFDIKKDKFNLLTKPKLISFRYESLKEVVN